MINILLKNPKIRNLRITLKILKRNLHKKVSKDVIYRFFQMRFAPWAFTFIPIFMIRTFINNY